MPISTLSRYKDMRAQFRELLVNGSPINSNVGYQDWYIDSVTGTATNLGTSPTEAISSLATLLDSGNLSAGDRIFLMAGHVETVSAAAGVDVGTAGLPIFFFGGGGHPG